ncbi:MAG TPA: RagB/SusD family nutrient uptake outer membrane protein [Bacteroides reticulotermitis]|nr:RagB/SusD family nutrient uptake outer membrane protein [Bacteroides reticulotermitis]
MKLKNIILIGLTGMTLASCNDFLDVDSPSSYSEEFVFTQKSEMNRVLNGVYASILVNDLYGNAYQRTFVLNSDVDMQIFTGSSDSPSDYACFNCNDQGSEIDKFWKAGYKAIEDANRFIYGMENSKLYNEKDAELMQMIGEAKCLRAMVYHDLTVMFGDVPFTFTAAAQLGNDYVVPVTKREDIQNNLIKDLESIAPKMNSSSNVTVERASKEFAWALIARIALSAGGYSLHPVADNASSYGVMSRPQDYQAYYRITKNYTDSIIKDSKHSLGDSYSDVFVKESNFNLITNGDPIFEIPFAKESTGNTGYIQGPTSTANAGYTLGKNVWGASSGNGRLSAFYRYSFKENDKRRDYLNGLWYYGNADKSITQDSCLIRADYTVHNNKWSKLWANSGQFVNSSTGSTGINYPYMRFADVLLMHAEAVNELDGPTAEAQESLRRVRERAFDDKGLVAAYVSEAASSKEDFLNAVLDERKWEFAGENMRWRDLVRNNLYAREVVYSFLRYLSVALGNAGAYTGFEDEIAEHDGSYYLDNLPEEMYYHVLPQNAAWKVDPSAVYGYPYPNKTLDILYIYNPYKSASRPATSLVGFEGKTWLTASFYQWQSDSEPTNQCKYSFYGYIRRNTTGVIELVKDATTVPLGDKIPEISELPVVRYILPYPNAAIQRSAGAYKNYYGYK